MAEQAPDGSRRRRDRGEAPALGELIEGVYGELRRRASASLRRERSDHTLQTTELVHETYLRLLPQSTASWESRAHFLSLAALMMRRILVDHARRRRYPKRGGGVQRVPLGGAPEPADERPPDLAALDDALQELSAFEPQLARIVELRFFGGLPASEIAGILGVSEPTVHRRWRAARAWLYSYLAADAHHDA